MDPLSEQELRQFAPHIKDVYLQALTQGWPLLQQAGINTPLRICHFMAQVAHETGGFTIVREYTNWTPAQMCKLWPSRFRTVADPRILKCRGDQVQLANLAYSGRADIGNEGGNDGWDYRGGGFMQTTGRDNYRMVGEAIGVDLEGHPELIEDGLVSLKAALWEWSRESCNHFADFNYGRAIGNAINRGNPYSKLEPIGASSREQWLVRAWALFGAGELPNPEVLALGAFGQPVLRLQRELRDLGYGVGSQDQVFGPTLARAVAAFKLDAKRRGAQTEPDEIVGPLTWKALDEAEPVKVSPERASTTAEELAAAGSQEVKAGQQQKLAATAVAATGAAGAAAQLGVLDAASASLGQISAFKAAAVPAIEAMSWGLKHVAWVAVILAAIWVWHRANQGIAARLWAHVTGMNLWR